jgi:hypothetical protein
VAGFEDGGLGGAPIHLILVHGTTVHGIQPTVRPRAQAIRGAWRRRARWIRGGQWWESRLARWRICCPTHGGVRRGPMDVFRCGPIGTLRWRVLCGGGRRDGILRSADAGLRGAAPGVLLPLKGIKQVIREYDARRRHFGRVRHESSRINDQLYASPLGLPKVLRQECEGMHCDFT